jgi:hypothetical protein
MNMIFHAADEDGRAIELFGDAAEIRMKRIARGFVAQERPAVFGGKDQMNVNGRKRLWHSGTMANPRSSGNPKGIVSSSPGLRGTSNPGKAPGGNHNPNGVVAKVTRGGENELAATALRLEIVCGR